MKHLIGSLALSAAALVLGLAPQAADAAPRCGSNQFEMDGRCWHKGNRCSDYNGTSHNVCNNPHDSLQCDWNGGSNTCYPENGGGRGCGWGEFEWGGRCWQEGNHCSDYNGTHKEVCENNHDDLRCKWKSGRNKCEPRDGGGGGCGHGEFWMDGGCWNIGHRCSDYNGTSHNVCNNPHDSLQCDWNRHSQTCYPG
jgi:hypothetical protein